MVKRFAAFLLGDPARLPSASSDRKAESIESHTGLLPARPNLAMRKTGGHRDANGRHNPAVDGLRRCARARNLPTGFDGRLVSVGPFLLVLLAIYACRKVLTLILTWRALAWLPSLSRRLSRWVKARDYTEEEFFRADGAAGPWVERRKQVSRPARRPFSRRQHQQSIAWAAALCDSFSDLRVRPTPIECRFPLRARVMREKEFNLCSRSSPRRAVLASSISTATGRST